MDCERCMEEILKYFKKGTSMLHFPVTAMTHGLGILLYTIITPTLYAVLTSLTFPL